MKFTVIISIFLVLILLDKALTYVNLTLVKQTNPENYLSIEKNPMVRYFFQHQGLLLGTLIAAIVSLITLFIAYYVLIIWVSPERALWYIVLIYSLVIGNNIFFALKFGGVFNST